MCGIFAYAGNDNCTKVIINGLKSLEYRGYDSWGIALRTKDTITLRKNVGKVSEIKEFDSVNADMGIGHTRWATHGNVTVENSHPHSDSEKQVYVVHNGIIENVKELKEYVPGDVFYSKTDTEIIPKLIARFMESSSFPDAVKKVVGMLKGNFAFVAVAKNSEYLIAARNGSPVVAAKHNQNFYISSDLQSLTPYSETALFINDGELLIYDSQSHAIEFYDFINNKRIQKEAQIYDVNFMNCDRGSYKHFMLKEIFEQPEKLKATFDVNVVNSEIRFHYAVDPSQFKHVQRIVIIACGTSWHAGLVAEYWFESLVKIPVEVEYASEFRYRNPVIDRNTLIIAISQSGETADTIAGIKEAKKNGAQVLSICNVPGSTITRISDATVYTQAGPEIGVASTKAFTTQLEVLFLLALMIAHYRDKINDTELKNYLDHLVEIPEKMNKVLINTEQIISIMQTHYIVSNALFLGRGVNYPIALEGALKLKEISYIHAEGYPAAEMKHGPIALIDRNMPTVFICIKDHSYDKVLSNIEEVKARDGIVIAVANDEDQRIGELADHVIFIPETIVELSPFLTVVPLQLLAYHIADKRGCDIDKPRNLAKSVTVE
ncbi:MAG: glutamine--fructose-6-phosphate transaminase (isomerizing) [Candidatus Marinimicrobia bacterium]|nr:glutamine--fructose-6-phosphate transaminase (isomerizing) [Candidatus Neomarinimicrobiota bacterium]